MAECSGDEVMIDGRKGIATAIAALILVGAAYADMVPRAGGSVRDYGRPDLRHPGASSLFFSGIAYNDLWSVASLPQPGAGLGKIAEDRCGGACRQPDDVIERAAIEFAVAATDIERIFGWLEKLNRLFDLP